MWRPLLSSTVHEELSVVDGLPVNTILLVYVLVLAGAVALAVKVVGILLVIPLLIIPAAAARPLGCRPKNMGILASVCGFLSVVGGSWGSANFEPHLDLQSCLLLWFCFWQQDYLPALSV